MKQKDLSDSAFILITKENLIVKKKIEELGKPLSEWDININRGVLTGLNEAFIISSATKDELIAKDPRSEELIKPLLRGRDIKRYNYEFANKWLINSHNNPSVDIDKYPAIKEHLNLYIDKLKRRTDKGYTPYNLRNCAYLDKFMEDKIVYAETMRIHKGDTSERFPRFGYANSFFIDKTCFMITGKNLKYILMFLNSKLGEYLVHIYIKKLDTGGFNMQTIFVSEIPIIDIETLKQKPFITLADQIITLKKQNQDTTKLEVQIDRMVYELYGLSEDEVALVEEKK